MNEQFYFNRKWKPNTLSQSRGEINGNEGEFYTPQSFRTGASPLDEV